MYNERDLTNLVEHLQARAEEQAPASLENLILSMILNPVELGVQRIRLVDEPFSIVVSEVREGTITNSDGALQRIYELIINVATLDDGTPLNEFGIARCQNCRALVAAENLTRCLCGKTCCLRPDCARSSRQGVWYCSRKHKFWGKILGFFNAALR